LLAAIAGASVYFRPDRAIRVATGVDPTGDIPGVARLVKEVIAAVQP